jgi:GT2 family glycosyltransferase
VNPAPLVTAVVLSWNGRDRTLACLRSLEQVVYEPFAVLVVDNGSTDGSAEAVASEHPAATLVALSENRGFAGGMNVGIRAALDDGADMVVTLNNDMEVDPGFVGPLVDALATDPSAAAACPQILFAGRPARIWYAGAPLRAGRGHSGRNTGYGEPPLPLLQPHYETPRACGGAMLAGRESFASIGLFDDDLFAYAEDTDWSLRAASSGRHVLVVPASVVTHGVSASSGGEGSPDTIYYALRNGLVVAERHAPRGTVATWLRRIEAVAAHLAQALLSTRRREGARAVHDGWRDFRRQRLGARRA